MFLASPAPVFRLVHRFGGTLIIDEIELNKRDSRNEDFKEILRAGKDSGGRVFRCDKNNYDVKGFKAFGPKIIGSREASDDSALESRIFDIQNERIQGYPYSTSFRGWILGRIKYPKEKAAKMEVRTLF